MQPTSCANIGLNVTFEKLLLKHSTDTLVKVKVNFTLEHTTKAQKGSKGIDLFSP